MSPIKSTGIGISLLILAIGLLAGTRKINATGTQAGRSRSASEQQKNTSTKEIILLPLDKNLPPTFTNGIFQKIKSIVPGVTLHATEALPKTAYYAPRKRYRADSLIAWMARRAGPNQVYAGIMRTDVSTTKNGVEDWGVMGLGYQPGKACVSSDFRLKNKSAFWKVVIHELGHTTGLPHCPVKTCFMRDAEGGNPTDEEKEFCSSCKSHLLKSGWML